MADLGISDDSDGEWEPEPSRPNSSRRARGWRGTRRARGRRNPGVDRGASASDAGGATNETKPWEPLSGTRGESAERGCDEGTRHGNVRHGNVRGGGPGSEAAEAVEEAVEEAEAMHAEEGG